MMQIPNMRNRPFSAFLLILSGITLAILIRTVDVGETWRIVAASAAFLGFLALSFFAVRKMMRDNEDR
jgi:hypothetical protein